MSFYIELDAALKVGSHKSKVEAENHLSQSAGHAASDEAQNTVGFLSCKQTVPSHVQFFIYLYLLCRAALKQCIILSVLLKGIDSFRCRTLHLALLNLMKFLWVHFPSLSNLSAWHLFPSAYQWHHSAWCDLQSC